MSKVIDPSKRRRKFAEHEFVKWPPFRISTRLDEAIRKAAARDQLSLAVIGEQGLLLYLAQSKRRLKRSRARKRANGISPTL